MDKACIRDLWVERSIFKLWLDMEMSVVGVMVMKDQ